MLAKLLIFLSRSFPFRRTWLLLPFDILALSFALLVSFELRFSFSIPHNYVNSFLSFLYIRPIVYLGFFLAFRMYTRVWRYASMKDLKAIVWSTTLATIMIKLIDIIMPSVDLPNSIWLSTYLLTLVSVAGIRVILKIYGSTNHGRMLTQADMKRSRVLIYGAGSAGAIVSREAQRDHYRGWDIAGFVDDDKHKRGLLLNGLPILGSRSDIHNIVVGHSVDRILIAIPSMARNELRHLVDEINTYKVPILIIPPFTRWAVNNLFAQVRPVDVEDLLGRDPLPIDVPTIGSYLENAVILVTGAGGSIGSEICRQVATMNPKLLVLLGRGENSIFEIHRELRDKYPDLPLKFYIGDIRDRKKMTSVFRDVKPDVVFHAAAHKHVPLMESHPDEAFQNNVLGTKILTELALRHKVQRFILISSDKAVRPTNVMGASKRIAEMVEQEIANRSSQTTFVAVRFGNVLGSRGSVVRVFRDQISKGGPVTVTDARMQRYFMTIPEAVRLVIEAGAVGENGRVYLLDMGQPVRIMDLATRMIRLSGFVPDEDIPIQITGIRPGEKLFEELSRESDSVSIDPNQRIWSMQCPVMSSSELDDALAGLAALYDEGDLIALATAIKELAWWEPAGVGAAVAAGWTDAATALAEVGAGTRE